MTLHPQRYIRFGFLVLLFVVVTPPVADWCGDTFRLPPGYGAAGDSRFNQPGPAAVRETVNELSAECEGSWVEERIEGGSWVYDLHTFKDGQPSEVRIDVNGQVMPPAPQTIELEGSTTAEEGE